MIEERSTLYTRDVDLVLSKPVPKTLDDTSDSNPQLKLNDIKYDEEGTIKESNMNTQSMNILSSETGIDCKFENDISQFDLTPITSWSANENPENSSVDANAFKKEKGKEDSESEDDSDETTTDDSSEEEDTESEVEYQNNHCLWQSVNSNSKQVINENHQNDNMCAQGNLEDIGQLNQDDSHSTRSGLDDVLNQYHQPGAEGNYQQAGQQFNNPTLSVGMFQTNHSVHYPMMHAMGGGTRNMVNYQSTQMMMNYRKEEPVDFPCQECGKVYNNRSSLRSHIKKHYPEEEKKYKCDQCSYSSHYHKNLLKHTDLNHGENENCSFHCDVCDKRFSNDSQLKEHKMLHTSDNTYTCDQCNKQFKTKLKLKYHMDVHNPEKPYVCDIGSCDRAFRTPKYLKNHKDEFHKLQPKTHECPVCEQVFQRKSHLKRHMTTHDGEKKYHCSWPECNRSFRSQETVNIHYFRHTGEKPFKCELCDFKCRQKSALNYHYKHTHAKDAHLIPRNIVAGIPSIGYHGSLHQPKLIPALRGQNISRSSGDVYNFTTELDSHHDKTVSNKGQPRQSDNVQLDDDDSQMESHIDGIINHLAKDNNLMDLFSSSRSELLAGRISSIVADVISRNHYDFFATSPLTMQEIFYVEQSWLEACKQPPKQPGRKRKSESNPLEDSSPRKHQCPNTEYLLANSQVPSISGGCLGMDSSVYPNANPMSTYSSYHSPTKMSDQGNLTIMERPEEDEGVGEDCDIKSIQDEHSIVEDSVGLGLHSIDCGDEDDASDSNCLPSLISRVSKDIAEEAASLAHIDQDHDNNDDTRVRDIEEKDLLAQVLEDLKVIEQHDVQRHLSTGQPMTPEQLGIATPLSGQHHSLSAFSDQQQPAFPPQDGQIICSSVSASGGTTIAHNPTVTSTSDPQQPKSLDSSLWSDSGYSSGHDSGGVQQSKPDPSGTLANGLSCKSAVDSALSSASTLLDMYNPYSYSTGTRQAHGYGIPNPYDATYGRAAAGFGDLSQAYRASGLGSTMGDHLRSLTALGSKYMDTNPYAHSSQLPGFPDRSSLSGLSSTPHMAGLPGWPSTAGGRSLSTETPTPTPLQYPWPVGPSAAAVTPSAAAVSSSSSPVSSAGIGTVGCMSTDYSGYADYLSARAAASSLNPFDPTGGKGVDAYRSALNDYRSLTQTPAADLYSQMAASANYDKYASLYGNREGFYGSGQRGLSLAGESPFQPKQTSPYSDRSYITGTNPFYPQSSQYYLAAGRQFAPTGPAAFTDPYRNPMLHNMPFNRYPF